MSISTLSSQNHTKVLFVNEAAEKNLYEASRWLEFMASIGYLSLGLQVFRELLVIPPMVANDSPITFHYIAFSIFTLSLQFYQNKKLMDCSESLRYSVSNRNNYYFTEAFHELSIAYILTMLLFLINISIYVLFYIAIDTDYFQ